MEWLKVVADLAVPVSLIITILSFANGRKREAVTDGKQDAAQMATVLVELGGIKSSMERIEKRMDVIQEQISDIDRRVTEVGKETEFAHKRIDEIAGQLHHD